MSPAERELLVAIAEAVSELICEATDDLAPQKALANTQRRLSNAINAVRSEKRP